MYITSTGFCNNDYEKITQKTYSKFIDPSGKTYSNSYIPQGTRT